MDIIRHLYDTGKVIYEGTAYGGGDLEIRDATEDGKLVRILLVDGARESASFRDPALRNALVFKYASGFNDILNENPHLHSALLIGGAGFSYPKHFIANFPDKTMDVVEIDQEMVDLAFKYFYLDELFFDYDLHKSKRLNIFVEDGNDFLQKNEKKYDIVFNDAYIAFALDEGLRSERGMELVKKSLNPNGIYVINVITAISGSKSGLGSKVGDLLKKSFKYTAFRRCSPDVPASEKQNCLLIGSDFPL